MKFIGIHIRFTICSSGFGRIENKITRLRGTSAGERDTMVAPRSAPSMATPRVCSGAVL